MKRAKINKGLVVAGGLTVLTAIFLLFHFESHFAKAVHQIAGFALVGLCIIHTKMNWKALTNSFFGRKSVWVAAAVFAASVVIMITTGSFDQ